MAKKCGFWGGFWDWVPYYWRFRHSPPRGTTLKAIKTLESSHAPHNKPIVDLGTGQGADALAFLHAGWRVIAVDTSRVAVWTTRMRAIRHRISHRLDCIQSPIEEVVLSDCAGMAGVNASFSLPFSAQEAFAHVWQRLVDALPAGGVFSGQFFGLNDTWARTPMPNSPTWHVSREDVAEFFQDFIIVDFKEVDEQGGGPRGEVKHWHVYHVVAVKK